MKTRIVNILIGAIIGAALLWLLQPKHVDQSDILKQKDLIYKHRIDSLDRIIVNLAKRDTLWAHTVHMLRIEKFLASQASENYRKKYEKIKNTPVPHLSDDEINRAIKDLYPR